MIFGLYGLTFYISIILIGLALAAIALIVVLAVGLITHPLRTIALILSKLSALVSGIALLASLASWYSFTTDEKNGITDVIRERAAREHQAFYLYLVILVAGLIVHALCEWFLERPTRAERKATVDEKIGSLSTLHRDVVRGIIDPTPSPIRWFCEDGGRLWTAYIEQRDNEKHSKIMRRSYTIIIREYRDVEAHAERFTVTHIPHKSGRNPEDEVIEGIVQFSGIGGYPTLTHPIVHSI